jgi:hypothetical protein
MARRKMSLKQLSEMVDITLANQSILKEQQGQGGARFHPGGHQLRPGLQPGYIWSKCRIRKLIPVPLPAPGPHKVCPPAADPIIRRIAYVCS